jgi:hypothetical protein
MRRPFLTLLRSRRGSCPRRLLILHSLHSAHTKSAKFAPCFQSHAYPFSLLAKERNAISIPFNHFHTILQECRGVGPPKCAHQSASARPATRSNRAPQHRPGKRTGSGRCSLFAAVSLFRHIVTSSLHPEKPYLAPYHLMAKRYRTYPCSPGVYSGFRVCFRCLGLKWSPGFRVCLTNPDKRKSYLQTLS